MSWHRPTAAEITVRQGKCDAWNAAHPVGTAVEVQRDNGNIMETTTRSEALLLAYQPVIQVKGIPGCYLLDRVHPTP